MQPQAMPWPSLWAGWGRPPGSGLVLALQDCALVPLRTPGQLGLAGPSGPAATILLSRPPQASVYCVAAVLWTAAKFSVPREQKLALPRRLKTLLLDMARRHAPERPSVAEAIKVTTGVEPCSQSQGLRATGQGSSRTHSLAASMWAVRVGLPCSPGRLPDDPPAVQAASCGRPVRVQGLVLARPTRPCGGASPGLVPLISGPQGWQRRAALVPAPASAGRHGAPVQCPPTAADREAGPEGSLTEPPWLSPTPAAPGHRLVWGAEA